MTTKPPSKVVPAQDQSVETIAYAVAAAVPTLEPHDQDRLGYCLWLWLTQRKDSLEMAVRNAGIRSDVDEAEVVARVRTLLRDRNIAL